MNRIVYFILSLFFIACSSGAETQKSTLQSDGKVALTVFDQELKKINTPQLIDVRTPEEFAKGHLPNAKNINFNAATFDNQINQLDKNKAVFIYCHSFPLSDNR